MKRKSVSSSWRNRKRVMELMVDIKVKMEMGNGVVEIVGANEIPDEFLIKLSNGIMSTAASCGIQMGIKRTENSLME